MNLFQRVQKRTLFCINRLIHTCKIIIFVLWFRQHIQKGVDKMDTGPIEVIISGGTFGLPTYGHLEMWLEAARTARKLMIVIANNPGKKPIFSPRERLEMISAMVSDIPNVEIRVVGNKYLVRFAKEVGATDVFRGVRNNNDLLEEQIANSVNRLIEPNVSCKLYARPCQKPDQFKPGL